MIVAMDLNVSPVPEEDEETFDRHIEEYSAPEHEECVESAVDIARRIQCKRRGSVPDNPSVHQFVYEVSQFLLRQKHAKKYILVHCTHGHNRTGYMIVHYLMRSQISMSVTQAIAIFAEARPPGIYKPDYIEALYAFYHERKPEKVFCPATPEWERSSEFDLNGEAVPDDDDDGGSAALVHESHELDVVMTNDDILGDEISWDQQDDCGTSAFNLSSWAAGQEEAPNSQGHIQSR